MSAVFDFIKTNVQLAIRPDHHKFSRTTRFPGLVSDGPLPRNVNF